MSVPWHHYTHALHILLEDSPDLTVCMADGQVLCHKPVLACHSPFLRDALLHPDTDSIVMPDFGKEDLTHLVDILYGRVPQASVSAQLLKVLGIAAPSLTREKSSLGQSLPPSSAHTYDEIQYGANRVKADKSEETEKNYLCHNCSAFFSSQTRLYGHIGACGVGDTREPCGDGHEGSLEGDTGNIIYQCSLCSLVCSDLEELHNHMDVHSNEGFADENVIFMDEGLKKSKEIKIKTQQNVQVEMITGECNFGEEVITEELDEHEFLIADEEVEVQDPSIETTEVIVSSDEELRQDLIVNSNMNSYPEEGQKEIINEGDLTSPQKVHDMLQTNKDKSEFTVIPKVFCQFCEDSFDSMNDLNTHTITSHFELFQNLHMTEGDNYLTGAFNYENTDAIQVANQEQNLFYRCTLCENSFDTTKALLQHVTSNHETNPQNILPVSCCHCSRSFTKRTFLAKHYRVAHRGLEQIFQCPECGKILKAAKTLENHELRHTGLKPFQCGLCQMKFYSGSSLRDHVRKGCGNVHNANRNIPVEVSSHPVVSLLVGPNNVKSTKNETKPVKTGLEEVAVPTDQSQFNENDYEEMNVDNDSSNSSDRRLCEDRKKKVVCSEENFESISVAMDLEGFKNGVLMQGTEGDVEQCCDVCSYKTRRKNDFKRHLETRRHKENHEKYIDNYMEETVNETHKVKTVKEQEPDINLAVVDGKTEKVRSINAGLVYSNGNNSKLIGKTLAASDVVSEAESSRKQYECLNSIRIDEDDNLQREVIAEHSSVCESSSNIFTKSVMIADFVFAEDDQVIIVDNGTLEKKNEDSENNKEEIIIEDKNSNGSTQSKSSEKECTDIGVYADLVKDEDILKDYDLDMEAKSKEVPVPREMTVNEKRISDLGVNVENVDDSEISMMTTSEKSKSKLVDNDASHTVCIYSEQGDKRLKDNDTHDEGYTDPRKAHDQMNLTENNNEIATKCPIAKYCNEEFIRTVEVEREVTKEETEENSLIKETTNEDKSIASVSNVTTSMDLECIDTVVDKVPNTNDISTETNGKSKDIGKLANDTGSIDKIVTYCEIEGSANDANFQIIEGIQNVEAENSNLMEEDNVDKDVGTSIFREAKEPEINSSNADESFRNQSTESQPTDRDSESSVKAEFVSISKETENPENNSSNANETFNNQSTESQSTDSDSEASVNKETEKPEINTSNVDGTFINQSTKLESAQRVSEASDNVEFVLMENPVNPEALNLDNNNAVKEITSDGNLVEKSFPIEKVKGLKEKIGKLKEKSKMKRNIKLDSTCKLESMESKVYERIKPISNSTDSDKDSRDKAKQESGIENIGKVDTHSDVEASDITLGEVPKSIERTDDGILEERIRIEKAQKVGDIDAFVNVDIAVVEDLENKDTKHDVHYWENNGNLDAKTVSADKKKQFRERISELKAKAENLKRKREVEKTLTSHSDSISSQLGKKFKTNENCTKTGEFSRIKFEPVTSGGIKESIVNVDSVEVKTKAEITEGSNFADEDENTGQTRKYKLRRIKEKKKNNNDSNDSSTLSSQQPSSNASRIEKLRKLQAKLGVLKARSENVKVESTNVHTESQNKPEHPNNIESNDDEIASNCDLCPEYFESRRKLFVHMMTHVPAGIRANLPEGEHGWCPQCPGPVLVHQVNAHVADCHPEPVIDEISGVGDSLEVLGDGFEPAEMQPDERNTGGSGIQDLTAKCSPVSVKLIPVNLAEYGVNVKDYM